MTKKEISELKSVLNFLLDKVEECYQYECNKLVEDFLNSHDKDKR